MIVFVWIFGTHESLKILKKSPLSVDFNGAIILFSSLLAGLLVILLMRKRLSLQPYPYFMLGFYVGNLTLLLISFTQALLNKFIIWKFPECLLLFFAPFMELFIDYLFGFAFLVLIPAWLSAYVLFKLVKMQKAEGL